MINHSDVISLIKSSGKYEGEDLDITVDELITLNYNIPPDEIIEAIAEIDDIRISDRGNYNSEKLFQIKY
jgi:hypothetical protein